MSDDENTNELRCAAHEIIATLYEKKAHTHLTLLLRHCEKALERLEEDNEITDELVIDEYKDADER